MFGGFEKGIEENTDFFLRSGISPVESGIAIDLGSGCGFQSIPLACLGYSVISIDISQKLLDELRRNSAGLDIQIFNCDLLNFAKLTTEKMDLIVCMTDTILHLESKETVISLFEKAALSLQEEGKFIITFRCLTNELRGLNRFIPVKSDNSTSFTCFLEYEKEKVRVHDIIYKKINGKWTLKKGCYSKLRLSGDWVRKQLSDVGFNRIDLFEENRNLTIIAIKS